MRRARDIIFSFLPLKARREIKELYLSTMILNFAIMMIQIFEPIYLYRLGYDLHQIIFYFLIVYLIYFFILPLGANFSRHFGNERSIVVSTFVFIMYYFIFYNIKHVPEFFYIAPLFYAVQKSFYWPAYNTNFARYAQSTEDGREVASSKVLIALVTVLGPLVSGIILKLWGFGALFTFAALLFALSNVPLLTTKERFKPEPSVYLRAYRELFSKKNRRSFFGYLGYGEELIVLVVWPVFIATIIADLFDIGAIVAGAMLVTLLVTIFVGRNADRRNKQKILVVGSIVYALVWFMRLAAKTGVGVFFIDTFSRVSKNLVSVPLEAITYERAKKKSILDFIVFFELSLIFGKLVALMLVFIILFFVPHSIAFPVVFVSAGLLTLLYMLI